MDKRKMITNFNGPVLNKQQHKNSTTYYGLCSTNLADNGNRFDILGTSFQTGKIGE